MSLSDEFGKHPDQSQMEVFQSFTSRLMQLQKQLDLPYHGDRYLRDQILTAVDIPSIQMVFRDKIPRTAEQAINRIANRLSEQRNTAGSSVAYMA